MPMTTTPPWRIRHCVTNGRGTDSFTAQVWGPPSRSIGPTLHGKDFDCPNLYPFVTPREDSSQVAMWLGYHFLGGHIGTPWTPTNSGDGLLPWISPQKNMDDPSLVLSADFNHWHNVGSGYAIVPHARAGPLGMPSGSRTVLRIAAFSQDRLTIPLLAVFSIEGGGNVIISMVPRVEKITVHE